MFRKFMVLIVVLVVSATVIAQVVFPSTNDVNKATGWAYVEQISVGIETTDLTFVSTRTFASCFEYRTDGDTSQVIGNNYNSLVTDGLYPFFCVNNSSHTATITANQYVEVRMAFGAESDERFNWTRFDVIPDVQTKDQCINGGWETFGFSNQGQCVRFVESGNDSR